MTRRIGFCCQWFLHDRTLKKKQLEEIERANNQEDNSYHNHQDINLLPNLQPKLSEGHFQQGAIHLNWSQT